MKNTYKHLFMCVVAFGSFGAFAENPHDPIEMPKSETIDCAIFEERKDVETKETVTKLLSDYVPLAYNAGNPLDLSNGNGLVFRASYKAQNLRLQVFSGGDLMLAESDSTDFTKTASIKILSSNENGVYYGMRCNQRISQTFRKLEFTDLDFLNFDFDDLKVIRMKKLLRTEGEMLFSEPKNSRSELHRLLREKGPSITEKLKALEDYYARKIQVLDRESILFPLFEKGTNGEELRD